MRPTLSSLALFAGLALGLSACGVRSGNSCSDYRFAGTCSDGYYEVCQTTRGGCRQCSCVAPRTPNGPADFDRGY